MSARYNKIRLQERAQCQYSADDSLAPAPSPRGNPTNKRFVLLNIFHDEPSATNLVGNCELPYERYLTGQNVCLLVFLEDKEEYQRIVALIRC